VILVCVKDLTAEEYKFLTSRAKKVIASDWEEVEMFGESWKERNELLVGDGWCALIEINTDSSGEDCEDRGECENEPRATVAIELKHITENEEVVKLFLKGKCTLAQQ
jgi:hypothetical protein